MNTKGIAIACTLNIVIVIYYLEITFLAVPHKYCDVFYYLEVTF